MPERTCLVCDHVGLDPHWDILLRCPACGFLTARLDEPVDARAIYDSDYFTGQEYLDYAADEAFFKKNFRKRLRDILRRKPAGRLLEIGTAYGFFLDLARQHFDVLGFELNRQAARYAREHFGLDVRTDDFLTVEPETIGPPVDVTVMWDVLEHLERPDRFLARIADLSKPGALVYLTTGDVGSRLARFRRQRWRMIHPPSHLHYFDRNTITRLLAKTGFETVDIRATGVARSIRQTLYSILALRLKAPRAYAAIKQITPPTWGFTLNTFDIMQVITRKKGRCSTDTE